MKIQHCTSTRQGNGETFNTLTSRGQRGMSGRQGWRAKSKGFLMLPPKEFKCKQSHRGFQTQRRYN